MNTAKFLLCLSLEERQYLWNLFVEYTLFVDALIEAVINCEKFEKWRENGRISRKEIKSLCDQVKANGGFSQLFPRIYTSAILTVGYTFNSWFEVQKKLRLKISGKQKWLNLVMKDIEISQNTDFSSEAIQSRAKEILLQVESEIEENQKGSYSKMSLLFKRLELEDEKALSLLDYRAIVHLLKNSCQVNSDEEDSDQLALRLEKKGIEIERLEQRLNSRLPKGRDPLGNRYEQALENAISLPDPQENFDTWEQALPNRTAEMARQWKSLPYPLLFGSTDDLYWSRDENKQSPISKEIKEPCHKRTEYGSKSASDPKDSDCSLSFSPQSDEESTHTRLKKPRRCRTRKRRKEVKGRIFVRFKGTGLSHLRFAVYCDRRQHPIVEQFLTDYSTYKSLKEEEKFSIGLFALRSARLLWREDLQKLDKKNHWKLQNLWLKWFCEIQTTKELSLSHRESEQVKQETELWWRGLFYLKLSTILPWKTHRLHLHCTYDPRLLTAEGTDQVRLEKITQVRKQLEKMEDSHQQSKPLDCEASNEIEETALILEETVKKYKDRQAAIKHLKTSLMRLENNSPPPRPCKVAYRGDSHISVGVCFSLNKVVGVAVADQRIPCQNEENGLSEPIEYLDLWGLLVHKELEVFEQRSQKIREKFEKQQKEPSLEQEFAFEISGKRKRIRRKQKGRRTATQLRLENYRLVNRQHRARKRNLTQRGEEQKQGSYTRSNEESNLARYINHLIAKRIVELCYKWQASSIIIPNFANLRESVECEIQAKAKRLFCDDNVKLQKEFQKEIRMKMNRWNHKHLAQCIRNCAAKYGIPVKTGHQPKEGTMKEKAVAICNVDNVAIGDAPAA
jgi:IS605 OrfB family transposase